MSGAVWPTNLTVVLAAAGALVDQLQSVELTSCADSDLLDGMRELERLRRRIDSADYRLIDEVSRRGLPDQYGAKSTGRFLRHLLKVHPSDANARARAAEAAGPLRSPAGLPLAPVFEQVAAAQAEGAISQPHALLIEKTIDDLPEQVQAAQGADIETTLVGYAREFDPAHLGVLAKRIQDHVDPDGTLKDPAYRESHRYLLVTPRVDGSSHLEGELTAEATERLLTLLDALAHPAPAVKGVKDPRDVGQRQHDALLTAVETLQRTDALPSNNGVSGTIVVTMTVEQYLSGTGLARTAHGALVPAGEALARGRGDIELLCVAMNSVREITAHGNTHRLFTRTQRLAIAARDGGCTFPSCPEPPGRCQINHVQRHEHDGPTSIGNGALACRYNHREHEKLGWRNTMINGVPYWIPPKWIDPEQKPQRNTLHDAEAA